MPAKIWAQMTDKDKIEELRRDVVKLFLAINDLTAANHSLATHVKRMDFTLSEVADAVNKLGRK